MMFSLLDPMPWLRDADGKPVDELGRRVPVDSNGQPVDEFGQPIDRLGRLLDKNGGLWTSFTRKGSRSFGDNGFESTMRNFTFDSLEKKMKKPFQELLIFKDPKAEEIERKKRENERKRIEAERVAAESEKAAAVNIQRMFKGHIARKKMEQDRKLREQEEAERQQREKEELEAKQREEEERLRQEEAERLRLMQEDAAQRAAEEQAALKIQRIFKGHAARQEVGRMRDEEEQRKIDEANRQKEDAERARVEEEERQKKFMASLKEKKVGKLGDVELKSNVKVKKSDDTDIWAKAGLLTRAVSAFKRKVVAK